MMLRPEEKRELVHHRLNRAREIQKEAALLHQNNMHTAAVSRIYYSMFHALSALALSRGFQSGKHSGLIGWFNKIFVKTGSIDARFSKIITRSFEKRMDSDYDDFAEFAKEEVKAMLEECEDFILLMEKMTEG